MEFFRVGFVAGRRECHYGPFFESFEPQMLGDRGVEHSEGIEDLTLRDTLKAISDAYIGRLSRFVAITIHHQYSSFLEGRDKKRGSVRIVVSHLDYLRQLAFDAEVPQQTPAQAHGHRDNERGLIGSGARRK